MGANIRVNYRKLSSAQRAEFVSALIKLKSDGNPVSGRNYDTFVQWHLRVMQLPPLQMLAHGSPLFLPWHRECLRLLELDLQTVSADSTLTVPYWDWADPSAGADEPLWDDDFMGGNGRASDFKVVTGPFGAEKGDWPIVHDDTGMPYLSRAFGASRLALTLPPQVDVDAALAVDFYDVAPWDTTTDIAKSFRNNLEGGGRRRLHMQVHSWVGGDTGTMQAASSPNDPVFFLHHANIDRIWAHWQEASGGHVYLPTEEQTDRPGVSLHAVMPLLPGNRTPADVSDHRGLGYSYDTLARA